MSRLSLLPLALLGVLAVSGCGTAGYLVHVSMGQLRYLRDRELLDAERIEALGERERQGLELLRRAQHFGSSLGLRQSRSYRHVIDRDRDSAVRVVVAAPKDRLEAVTWWFPIVGHIAYRGYFDAGRAEDFAAALRAKGLDTYIRPSPLYSTLGFFDDPIPLEVLRWPEPDLVEVVLHELVHETVFVAGDSDYSEALASFIGMRGALAFLEGDAQKWEKAHQVFLDRVQFAQLIADLSDELRALYGTVDDVEEALEVRAGVFRRYQEEVYPALRWRTQRHHDFTQIELSNAYLVAQGTYNALLPCFARELAQLGADLRAFIAAHVEFPGRHGCEAPPSADQL